MRSTSNPPCAYDPSIFWEVTPTMPKTSTVNVAVAQPLGCPFRPKEAVEKVVAWTAQAANDGASLVLFPEAFVGGYPWGLNFGTTVGGRTPEGRRTWQRYWDAAIPVPGPETQAMGRAAEEAGVWLAVGVIERDTTYSQGTLFCTLLYFSPEGELAGKHRKLKPTAAERLLWGEGDGSTMPAIDTEFATVGGLICWENYMPLARMAMYGKGVEIYLAPTADDRDRWQATMQHIATEGRCFVLGCNQLITKSCHPDDLEVADELEGKPEMLCTGGSSIYSPMGDLLAGPLVGEEGILHATLDLTEIPRSKFDFDVTGHYARPDVFKLEVNERSQPPVSYSGSEG